MSTRVTLNIGFYFENQHYAQLHAYLPRTEAVKISQLNLDEENSPEPSPEARSAKPSRQSKKVSEEEISEEEEDNENINDMDIENEENQENEDNEDNEENEEEDNDIDPEQQQEVEQALQQLQQEEIESQSSSGSFDSDENEDDMDEQLSEPSPTRHYLNHKTKRQKGETKDLIQLPDRRPRKNKNVDEATEVIRREEKERKRKQYLKKQIQAHEKATIDKILNETGKKLRQREEKEMQEYMEREHKNFKTLGDVPKVITFVSEQGNIIMTHKTSLFPSFMTTPRDLKMKETCSNCGQTSRYRLKGCEKFACSLPCYKLLAI